MSASRQRRQCSGNLGNLLSREIYSLLSDCVSFSLCFARLFWSARECATVCACLYVCVGEVMVCPSTQKPKPKAKASRTQSKTEPICCSTFHVFHLPLLHLLGCPKVCSACLCVCVCVRVAVCVCDINVSLANDAHVCDAAFCLHFYFNPHRCLLFSRQMLKPRGGEGVAGLAEQGAGYL